MRWLPLVVLLLAGCARNAEFTYTPITPPAEKSGIAVFVKKFRDVRSDKVNIGKIGGLLKVTPSGDVRQWMTDALKAELKLAGYHVVEKEEDAPLTITGSVVWVDAHAEVYYHGLVVTHIVLSEGSKTLLDQSYTSRSSDRFNWSSNPRMMTLAVGDALQKAFENATSDVNKILHSNQEYFADISGQPPFGPR